MKFVTLSGFWELYPNRLNYVTFFDPLTLPAKKLKIRARLGPKLRWSLLLIVECLYGDTSLCKLDIHKIFSIFARGVFRNHVNIYDEAFSKIPNV